MKENPVQYKNVDYFSHEWNESDLKASWSQMTKRKKTLVDGLRLENASWRTWWQKKLDLKKVKPELLRWKKDEDITWLYGPLWENQREFLKDQQQPLNCSVHSEPIQPTDPNFSHNLESGQSTPQKTIKSVLKKTNEIKELQRFQKELERRVNGKLSGRRHQRVLSTSISESDIVHANYFTLDTCAVKALNQKLQNQKEEYLNVHEDELLKNLNQGPLKEEISEQSSPKEWVKVDTKLRFSNEVEVVEYELNQQYLPAYVARSQMAAAATPIPPPKAKEPEKEKEIENEVVDTVTWLWHWTFSIANSFISQNNSSA